MNEAELLAALTGRIYDAAIDASLWPSALESTCAFVGGCSANIFCQEGIDDPVTVFYAWGDDPEYRNIHVQSYADMNPIFPASAFLDAGEVHVLSDFMQARLHIKRVKPQGILDVMYCTLERTSTGAATIAVRRREVDGLFDDEAKWRFRLVVPHIRRAISIGHVIDFHRSSAEELAMTIDGLSLAVIHLRGDGEIVFANESAKEAMAEGSILRTKDGRRLGAGRGRADRELKAALVAADCGDARLGLKGMAIRLNDNSHAPQIAHMLSLKSGRRGSSIKGRATAAVFVRPFARPAPSSLEYMARLYSLTACETKVLEATFGGGSTGDISDALGVSPATVKTHLNHLYAKTGTFRRSELVQLATGFVSPLATVPESAHP